MRIPQAYFKDGKIQVKLTVEVTKRANNEAGAFDDFFLYALIPLNQCRNEQLFSTENFEQVRGEAEGWTEGRVSNGGKILTKYLGQFSRGDTTGKRYPIRFMPASVRIEFDLYELDSWDGNKGQARDYVAVYIDGERMDLGYFQEEQNERFRSDTTEGGIKWEMKSKTGPQQLEQGTEKALDQIHHVVAQVPPKFYAHDGELELYFQFVTSEEENDESGGVDNIKWFSVYNDCDSPAIVRIRRRRNAKKRKEKQKKKREKKGGKDDDEFLPDTVESLFQNKREKQKKFKWPTPPTDKEFTADFALSMEKYLESVLTDAIRFTYNNDNPDHCLYETNPTVIVTLSPKGKW
eukprot:CAMPEP_0202460870 /NCGR_PEP_ID=MMETSP1360-20130828/46330_1 /ASSEMBLY_ACC=CAM_ASM_000848 /TAXON_ID=515479 /ORGANISM="Licmophora paradoxa, Strain CCMP2313" /LENGTH=348 /DNA_ID=CAMNT_0049082697 /DNA_START=35 /DNA_END=1078 /DNA_ORIENTATION=-